MTDPLPQPQGHARPNCPLCGSAAPTLYANLTDWLFSVPGKWSIRRCRVCALAWVDPAPDDIASLYASYHTHRPAPSNRLSPLRDDACAAALARLGHQTPSRVGALALLLSFLPAIRDKATLSVMGLPPEAVGSVLDVGCGSGELAGRLSALGWKVTGVDPDPAAVQLARHRGVHALVGTVADIPEGPGFDYVTLNHVIEHAPDPVALLAHCSRRLRGPHGRVILTTPNLGALGRTAFGRHWRGLEVPRHIFLFSRRSLTRVAAAAGLQTAKLTTRTRLACMISLESAAAAAGARRVGEGPSEPAAIQRLAAWAFQCLEDAIVAATGQGGEELFCVLRPAT